MSLFSTSSKSQPKTSNAKAPLLAIARDTQIIEHAIHTLTHEPELVPMASILARYTGIRAMNACLGPSLSGRCQHCMEYLGLDLHDTSFHELCECCFSSICRYGMAHPLRSIQIAQESTEYIIHAIETLAALPDTFNTKHQALAKMLWQDKLSNDKHPHGDACPINTLQKGMALYNEKGKAWGDWLHVGLPEILSELQKLNAIPNEKALETFIKQQYLKWKAFGQEQLAAIQAHNNKNT